MTTIVRDIDGVKLPLGIIAQRDEHPGHVDYGLYIGEPVDEAYLGIIDVASGIITVLTPIGEDWLPAVSVERAVDYLRALAAMLPVTD